MSVLSPVVLSARTAVFRLAEEGAKYHLPEPRAWSLMSGSLLQAGVTRRTVLALHGLCPATPYRLEVAGLGVLDFRTTPCAGAVVLTDAAQAQAAIDATPAGGTLIIPAGRWEVSPLRLKSCMTLHLVAGAELAATADRTTHPVLAPEEGGTWEGLPARCYAGVLTAVDCADLAITGPGRIDGGGDRGDWWSWPKETRNGARRARLLHLIRCDRVTLAGPELVNSPSWTLHPWKCRDLVAAALTIRNPPDSPNTDGFDPESCENVLMEGIHFSVGDDCIAIKAGKRGPSGEAGHLAPTRRVTIRHCLMERGHGGVVLGSEMSGGIHDVLVERCEMVGTDRGLRLKTRRGRGGAMTGVTFRDVSMDGVETAFAINAHYFCDADGHADWVQSRAPAPVDSGTPQISGIAIDGVAITGLRAAFAAFLGLPEAPIAEVHIGAVSVAYAPSRPVIPLMADRLRAVSGAGILAEHCALTTTSTLPRGTLTI